MIRGAVALLFPCLMLGACRLVAPFPELPTPVRPPEVHSAADALRAAVEGGFPLDALTLGYTAGSEEGMGRTTLVVHGSGSVDVTFAFQGEHSRWSSTVTGDRFLALCRILVDHRIWEIEGGRPGEALATLTVEAEGFDPLNVGIGQGQTLEDSGWAAVRAFEQLAHDLGGGAVK